MSDIYKKEIVNIGGDYVISYWHKDIRQKVVNEDKPDYVAWLAVPNTPEVIPFVPPALPTFEENKSERIREVDSKTLFLLQAGVEFPDASSKFLPLVPTIDTKDPLGDYKGILNADLINPADAIFPLKYRYLDNTRYTFSTTADFRAFYTKTFSRVASVREGGDDIIEDLENSINQTELDAILDNRV